MKRRQVVTLALAVILIFVVSLSKTPGAGKPPSHPRAEAIFDDGPSYGGIARCIS